MLELNQLDIFPKNFHNPDIVFTYTLNKDETFDMFKMWISDECKYDMEVIDIANKLYFEIMVNNENVPCIKDLFIAYQKQHYNKQWKPYKLSKTKLNVKGLVTKSPYNNYTEITKTFLSESYNELMDKYIQKYNKKESIEE